MTAQPVTDPLAHGSRSRPARPTGGHPLVGWQPIPLQGGTPPVTTLLDDEAIYTTPDRTWAYGRDRHAADHLDRMRRVGMCAHLSPGVIALDSLGVPGAAGETGPAGTFGSATAPARAVRCSWLGAAHDAPFCVTGVSGRATGTPRSRGPARP